MKILNCQNITKLTKEQKLNSSTSTQRARYRGKGNVSDWLIDTARRGASSTRPTPSDYVTTATLFTICVKDPISNLEI